MTETSNTTIPAAVAVDVVIEVLSSALDDMKPYSIDVGHITGDDEPEVNLSLTSNWGSPDNLAFTLWNEDDEAGRPSELGTFSVQIRRVI